MTAVATFTADPATTLRADALPRLLPSSNTREDLAAHLRRLGPVPLGRYGPRGERLVGAVEAAGLLGRGGAGFPTAAKLRSVATFRRRPVVVVNAMEGEPASAKDHLLACLTPHLVLDGAVAVAGALGATKVVVCIPDTSAMANGWRASMASEAARSVRAAIAERNDGVECVVLRPPHRYVSGESSALVRWLNGGPALPEHRRVRVAEKGVGGRPTALDNAETFAHIGLVSRFGPDWFRALGTESEPGTALVTVSGAVARVTVAEVALGSSFGELVSRCGGYAEPPGAVLFGGYGGSWAPIGLAVDTPLSLRPAAGRAGLGPGIAVVLPATACGISETVRLVRYMAGETAGQCGPCVQGLPALAGALERVAMPDSAPDAACAVAQLRRWCVQLAGRGACNHPDGVVRLVGSALDTFAADVRHHVTGVPCSGAWRSSVVTLPDDT
jgi:NADH:ubiquinone oxidoreductase subunit F (NADH-binding)